MLGVRRFLLLNFYFLLSNSLPLLFYPVSLRCWKPQAYIKCVEILLSTVSSRYSTVKGLVI